MSNRTAFLFALNGMIDFADIAGVIALLILTALYVKFWETRTVALILSNGSQ